MIKYFIFQIGYVITRRMAHTYIAGHTLVKHVCYVAIPHASLDVPNLYIKCLVN